MTIKKLCQLAHQSAVDKGFWAEQGRNDGELLMLVVSELAEALEGLRHFNPASEHIKGFSSLEEELADAMIRIADMAEARECHLEEAIKAKMKYNFSRDVKHGKAF